MTDVKIWRFETYRISTKLWSLNSIYLIFFRKLCLLIFSKEPYYYLYCSIRKFVMTRSDSQEKVEKSKIFCCWSLKQFYSKTVVDNSSTITFFQLFHSLVHFLLCSIHFILLFFCHCFPFLSVLDKVSP